MVNFDPLTAEIGLPVWVTPANFSRFCVLATLLQRRHSPEANQTRQNLWPSPGVVHYIYIFGAFAPWRNFATCKIHFASNSCVLIYWQRYCTALQQQASAKLCGMVQGMGLRNFRRRRHLYSFGWAAITLSMDAHSSSLYMCCGLQPAGNLFIQQTHWNDFVAGRREASWCKKTRTTWLHRLRSWWDHVSKGQRLKHNSTQTATLALSS